VTTQRRRISHCGAEIQQVQEGVGDHNQGVENMVKYSRFAYEKKSDEDTPLDQATGVNGSILLIMMTEGARE